MLKYDHFGVSDYKNREWHSFKELSREFYIGTSQHNDDEGFLAVIGLVSGHQAEFLLWCRSEAHLQLNGWYETWKSRMSSTQRAGSATKHSKHIHSVTKYLSNTALSHLNTFKTRYQRMTLTLSVALNILRILWFNAWLSDLLSIKLTMLLNEWIFQQNERPNDQAKQKENKNYILLFVFFFRIHRFGCWSIESWCWEMWRKRQENENSTVVVGFEYKLQQVWTECAMHRPIDRATVEWIVLYSHIDFVGGSLLCTMNFSWSHISI